MKFNKTGNQLFKKNILDFLKSKLNLKHKGESISLSTRLHTHFYCATVSISPLNKAVATAEALKLLYDKQEQA